MKNKVTLIVLGLAILGSVSAGSLWLLQGNSSDLLGGLGSATKSNSEAAEYHLTVDGLDRQFIVYRPESLVADTAVPLVFMFHGGGGSGEKFYKMSGWKELADKEGFMVIFPTAAKYYVYAEAPTTDQPEPPAVNETRWSSYHLENSFHPQYPNQQPANDVAFVREMVKFVQKNYSLDSSRIYANGFSSGGFMVNRLLAEASDIFAAYGSSSSGMQPGDLEDALAATPSNYAPRPTAVMVGSVDSKSTNALGVRSFPTDESALADDSIVRTRFVDDYLALLGLTDDYDYIKTGKLSTFTFTTEAGRPKAPPVPFVFMIAAGMDHIFPNGKSYPIVAAELYWDFFKEYSLK
jgi:polyhydroxybutyrate depolymerase